MDIKEFVRNFADQLDDADAEVLTPETEFRQLDDWSSLAALSIIAMPDEEYGVSIASETFKNAKTIQDLFDQVNKKMTNLEKYNSIFKKMFNVTDDQLETLSYRETAEWNSMAQIALVAEIEEQFDLDFDTDDIFQLMSYVIGKELLANKFSVEF